jgi:hypothetical protein
MARWKTAIREPQGKVERGAVRNIVSAVNEVTSGPASRANDPTRDLARNRKLPLARVVWTLMAWGRDAIGVEFLDTVGRDGETPPAPALCQQMNKLRDDVMPRIHRAFPARCASVPCMGRY